MVGVYGPRTRNAKRTKWNFGQNKNIEGCWSNIFNSVALIHKN